MKRLLLAFSLFACSCANPGQVPADVTLIAHGASTAVLVDGAFTITLTRADVAFGPAYFCATPETAPDFCETALVETTRVDVIDGLDASPRALGVLRGFTGTIRSAQYDLGLVFLLTEASPRAVDDSVASHSVELEGTASNGATTFAWRASVDVVPDESGTTSIGQETEVSLTSQPTTLAIAVEPLAWIAGLDWAAIGSIPHAPAEPIVLAVGTAPYQSIATAVRESHRPTFTWTPAAR